MRSRQGQFEILGLTFVVVLVMLGVLFGLYVISKPEAQLARDFSQSQLASNWVNTYKGMSTECHGATMTRLLSDCATSLQIDCPGGQNACDYAREVTKNVLNATLDSWNRAYNFSIRGSSAIPGGLDSIQFSNGHCPAGFQKEIQPVPTGAGTIFLELLICD